jgi:hypothetical protein
MLCKMRMEYAGAIYRGMIRKTSQNEPNYGLTPMAPYSKRKPLQSSVKSREPSAEDVAGYSKISRPPHSRNPRNRRGLKRTSWFCRRFSCPTRQRVHDQPLPTGRTGKSDLPQKPFTAIGASTRIISNFRGAHAPSRVVSGALAGNFLASCYSPFRWHSPHVANDSGASTDALLLQGQKPILSAWTGVTL